MESASSVLPVVYYGHHKCGTTWLTSVCERIAGELGVQCVTHQVGIDRAERSGPVVDTVERRRPDILVIRNSRWDHVQSIRFERAVHVVRDPRDLLVSAYFSHRYSHPTDVWPELVRHRKLLNELSVEDGLIAELSYLRSVYEDMNQWKYGEAGILEMKYEELASSPYKGILQFARHLGLVSEQSYSPGDRMGDALRSIANRVGRRLVRGFRGLRRGERRLPVERVLGIAHEHLFEKMASGRQPGQEDVGSHFRKGTPGDWREQFTPRVRDQFKKEYGDLVAKLSYDMPDKW